MTPDDLLIAQIEQYFWQQILDNASLLISYVDFWGSMTGEAYTNLLDIIVMADDKVKVLQDVLDAERKD